MRKGITVLLYVCGFIWFVPGLFMFVEQSHALTIAVGGRLSTEDRNAGIVVTGRLIDSKARIYRLPDSSNKVAYSQTEKVVYKRAERAAKAGEPVILLGYSHGSQLILRIAHQLSGNKVPLANVILVTVDMVSLGYPLKPKYDSVPTGIARSLNIYETAFIIHGGPLNGATNNVDATTKIQEEYRLGASLSPDDPRFNIRSGGLHQYIQNSLAVRRRILNEFNKDYLPGIWQIHVKGTVLRQDDVDFTREFLLDYVDGDIGRFTAIRWVESRQDYHKIVGNITNSSLTGTFSFLTFASECPQLTRIASGNFNGATTYKELNLNLTGQWPIYDRTTCEDLGTQPFVGNAQGTLLINVDESFATLNIEVKPIMMQSLSLENNEPYALMIVDK